MNIFVGIGGRGIQILESFIYLCSCGLGPNEEVYALVIDADETSGNLNRTRSLLAEYQSIRKMGLGRNTEIFKTNLILLNDEKNDLSLLWTPWKKIKRLIEDSGERVSNLDLQSILGYNLMVKDDKDICDLFFTKNELETELSKGFRGRPSIGSAVFASIDYEKEQDAKGNKDQISNLLDKIKGKIPNEQVKLFVCGSIFGGTGASGVPNIPKILKSVPDIENNRKNLFVGGMLVLPYFSFPPAPADVKNRNELYADSNMFIANTKASLMNYDNFVKNVFDKVYVIGECYNSFNVGKFGLGAAEQINPPHYIELISGLSVTDFFVTPQSKKDNTTNPYYFCGRKDPSRITFDDLPGNSLYTNNDIKQRLAVMGVLGQAFLYYKKGTQNFSEFPLFGVTKNIKKKLLSLKSNWTIAAGDKDIDLVESFFKKDIKNIRQLGWFEFLYYLQNLDAPKVELFNQGVISQPDNVSSFSSVLYEHGNVQQSEFADFLGTMEQSRVIDADSNNDVGLLVSVFYESAKEHAARNFDFKKT